MNSKKLILILLCLILTGVLVGCAADAEARCRRRSAAKVEGVSSVVGVKIDAPNLVNIGKGWTLGAEGSKDIMKNIFHNDNSYYEADKGYSAYVKVTFHPCLLNCE